MIGKLKIIHTVNDPRCPIDQAESFVEKLKTAGKKEGTDFELVVIGDKGHGSVDINFRIQFMKEMISFFKKSL